MHLFSAGLGIVIAVVALWGTAREVWSHATQDTLESNAGGAMMYEFLGADAVIRVRGRVLDTHGHPVAGVRVVARPQSGHLVATGEISSDNQAAVTDALGYFVLPGLAPGSYAVVALHGNHPPGVTQVLLTQPRCGHDNDVRIVLDDTDLLIPA